LQGARCESHVYLIKIIIFHCCQVVSCLVCATANTYVLAHIRTESVRSRATRWMPVGGWVTVGGWVCVCLWWNPPPFIFYVPCNGPRIFEELSRGEGILSASRVLKSLF
jgi:hypothetical protein